VVLLIKGEGKRREVGVALVLALHSVTDGADAMIIWDVMTNSLLLV
jgi:hypothetical protein